MVKLDNYVALIMLRSVFTILFASWLCLAKAGDTASAKSVPAFAKLYLNTNSYFYQPNDPVYFTSFLLEAGSLEPINLVHTLDLKILNSRMAIIYSRAYVSSKGLVSDHFDKSLFNNGGEYTLVARVRLNNQVYECRRKIVVQEDIRSGLFLEVKPDKEQYSSGDSMHITLRARHVNGEAIHLFRDLCG